jgi:hypothetical protein
MDRRTSATPHELAREGLGLDQPLPDEPCAGRYSACGQTCFLADGSWTFETTMSIGGIDNDVQAYCQCEHHDGVEGPDAGLAVHIRERLAQARRQRRP